MFLENPGQESGRHGNRRRESKTPAKIPRRSSSIMTPMANVKYGRHSKKHGSRNRTNPTVIDLATRLLLRGEHKHAREILSAAVVKNPGSAGVQTRYGDALYQGGRFEEARDAYRRATEIDPGTFQAWWGCGMAEYSLEAYADAIKCLRRAAELVPRDPDVRCSLGRALFQMGEVDAAIDQLECATKSKDPEIRGPALRLIATIIPGSPSRGNADIRKWRERWASLAARKGRIRPASIAKAPKPSDKLRVGYVCSFFHHRNWMKPVWGVINHHNRSAFEIHLFADGGAPSAESGYAPHHEDSIQEITNLSNEDAADRIAAAGIDVLVDLNGYSAADRLGILIPKPAPVVVGWFNMYSTTGVPAFDYIVGDESVIPAEEERFYGERVLRVSGSYLAFEVRYPVPSVAPPPCLKSGWIRFGCFAPQYKITEEMIATWACILKSAPRAQLLLKSQCLADPGNRRAVHDRFLRHGITTDRVALELPAEHYEFLEAYGRVDIALDTFPYSGGTTTTEALWQGVPVLAVDGDRWASRTSKSILVAAGMDEWVQPAVDAYVRRAIGLANSAKTPARLAEMRGTMRERLLRSRACDASGLCRELEEHYRHAATISRDQDSSPGSRTRPNR
jgi:protein O-GlcNAc transferase